MREMPTHMGSEARDGGRTEGLPQVQESVLEHTAKENRPDEEITASALDVQKTDCFKENLPDWLPHLVTHERLRREPDLRAWLRRVDILNYCS